MEKSLRELDWSFVWVFCTENVQGYIMLNLLLLEAILYLYIFSYQYCNFIGQKLLS